jgi:hypothetical protein
LSVWRNGSTVLLDGHNRLDVCRRNGLRYEVAEIKIADRDDAKMWVIRNQFGRRNITPYQRCELALKLEPLIAKKAKANMAAGGGNQKSGLPKSANPIEPTHTRKEVAKQARVAPDTIAKAKKIAEKAPEPVKEKLRKGESTINKEYKAIVNAERKKRQVEAVRPMAAEPTASGKKDLMKIVKASMARDSYEAARAAAYCGSRVQWSIGSACSQKIGPRL